MKVQSNMNIFQQFIEFVHGPKELSLDHWRYRWIHWAHNSPQGERNYKLANFLYTNYCPLFHYSHFIILISPLLYLLKAIAWAIRSRREAYASREDVRRRKFVNHTYQQIKDFLQSYPWIKDKSFNGFRDSYNTWTDEYLVQNGFSAEWLEKMYLLVVKDIAEEERRKELSQKRIASITMVSQFIGKWIVVPIILLIVLGALGVSGYLVGPPIWELLVWLFNYINWWGVATYGSVLAGSLGLTFLLYKSGIIDKIYSMLPESKEKEIVYYEPKEPKPSRLWAIICKVFNTIGWCFYAVAVFIYTFYENACPPIILTEKKDASS